MLTARPSIRLDILRHGEPVGGKRYRGDQIDDPLSPQGWAQMQARIDECAMAGRDGWAAIVSSPLTRCRAFAEHLAHARGLPLTIDPNLRERGFGAWEGLSFEQVRARFPSDYRAHKADPARHMPAGGEAMDGFYQRVTQAAAHHAQIHADAQAEAEAGQNGGLLIIGHAVVMRTLAIWALNAPLSATRFVNTEYASLLSLRWQGDSPQLIGLNNDRPRRPD